MILPINLWSKFIPNLGEFLQVVNPWTESQLLCRVQEVVSPATTELQELYLSPPDGTQIRQYIICCCRVCYEDSAV